jgi:hypothetical protein
LAPPVFTPGVPNPKDTLTVKAGATKALLSETGPHLTDEQGIPALISRNPILAHFTGFITCQLFSPPVMYRKKRRLWRLPGIGKSNLLGIPSHRQFPDQRVFSVRTPPRKRHQNPG